jgi:hypothetical protein
MNKGIIFIMESMNKVEELERTLRELRIQACSIETGLNNVEMQLNELKKAYRQMPPQGMPQGMYQQGMPQGAPQMRMPQQGMPQQGMPPYGMRPQQGMPPQGMPQMRMPQQAAPAPQVGYPQQPYYNGRPQNMDPNHQDYAKELYGKLKKPENTSTEAWVGKILMGALASLLVFISLIFFAKLLLPFITDPIKIALMFVASVAIAAVGFVLSTKKPQNTFFTSLMACGFVCIYLSIVVTRVYFHAVSPIVMYVLLALWVAVILFLGRKREDWLFFSIGNLGFIVSIFFAAQLDDKTLVVPMLIYAIIIAAAFQGVFWKNTTRRKLQSFLDLGAIIVFHCLVNSAFEGSTETIIVGAVAAVWAFAMAAVYLIIDFYRFSENNLYFSVGSTLCFYLSYFLLNTDLKLPNTYSFMMLLLPGVIYEGANMYLCRKGIEKTNEIISAVVSGVIMFAAAAYASENAPFFTDYGFMLMAFALIVVYGVIRKSMTFKIQGWSLCLLSIAGYMFDDVSITLIIIATALIVIGFVVEGFITNDSVPFKMISYFTLLAWLMKLAAMVYDADFAKHDHDMVLLVSYAVIGLVNVVMILAKYYNTKTSGGGTEIHVTLDVINALAMVYGLIVMTFNDDNFYKAMYLVVITILACMNLPFGSKAKKGRFLYAAIKLGLILLIALAQFKVPDFALSVSMITFSVVCIVLGFKNRILAKELRIFGLVLTMVFVVKFILVDITYDNSAAKAISYLVSGILCFGISAIYNYFEKQGTNAG